MKFGDQGTAVLEVQEAVIAKGYDLPRYGADGHYGNETQAALEAYARDRNLLLGQPLPEELLNSILEGLSQDTEALSVELFDFRDKPFNARNVMKFKRVGGKPVIRDPSAVRGITIHQTAVKFSVADYQVKAAGGDRKLALARRSLGVACHVMAFHDGFLAWSNPLDWYVYHGNGWNATELGIEIDGNYPGLVGGKTWNGKPATEVRPESIKAARAGIELLVREGHKMGMPIRYIHAHRQSSASRRSDPGEELWNKVVLDYAIPVLGLETEPQRIVGDGRPIPTEWDPAGKGKY
jgi:peptidoglycan hydrolase-like protein with peptidoglycan-binding domain